MRSYENIQDIYPLSPLQEGLFFHALYNKSSKSYFEQLSYRFSGALDVDLAKKSVQALFDRHDVLRTQFFHDKADLLLQVVLQEVEADFHYESIVDKGTIDDKLKLIEEFKDRDKIRAFDLQEDLLMRVSIIKIDEQEYELIWSHHHIIADGWCVGVLIEEFFELYHSNLENRPHRLPQVQPYRRYIEWLQKQDKRVSENYWSNYLKGYEQPASIPRSREDGAEGYERQTEFGYFSDSGYKQVQAYAEKHQITVNCDIQGSMGYRTVQVFRKKRCGLWHGSVQQTARA